MLLLCSRFRSDTPIKYPSNSSKTFNDPNPQSMLSSNVSRDESLSHKKTLADAPTSSVELHAIANKFPYSQIEDIEYLLGSVSAAFVHPTPVSKVAIILLYGIYKSPSFE